MALNSKVMLHINILSIILINLVINFKENALSCAGLRDLRLTFLPAWLRNFVAASGLAHSTAAYDGGFGVYSSNFLLLEYSLISISGCKFP